MENGSFFAPPYRTKMNAKIILFKKLDWFIVMCCFIAHFEGNQMFFNIKYRTLKSVGRNQSYKKYPLYFDPPCI